MKIHTKLQDGVPDGEDGRCNEASGGLELPSGASSEAQLAYEHAKAVGWNEAVEACARLVEPKRPRPCDCERCYCGNNGDLEAVTAWDADAANAKAIRALCRSVQATDV